MAIYMELLTPNFQFVTNITIIFRFERKVRFFFTEFYKYVTYPNWSQVLDPAFRSEKRIISRV